MNLIVRDLFFNKICASVLISNKLRPFLYKRGGVELEKGVTICPRCFVGNKYLSIGERTFINYNVWFNTAGEINIGKYCNIGFGVTFITSTHEIESGYRRAGNSISKKIVIGDGTWIGAKAIILPGVKIGKGVIIGAGSVVTKDCEDDCVYAGNPARMIKKLEG